MGKLRELIGALGGSEVRTLLQSGNAVFEHGDAEPARLAQELEILIANDTGLTVPCVVREIGGLQRVLDANPFADLDFDPAKLVVLFLSGPVSADHVSGIDPERYAPDEFRLGEQEIYAYCPTGLARSKLPTALGNKRLGLVATARNWNTVTKLATMTDN